MRDTEPSGPALAIEHDPSVSAATTHKVVSPPQNPQTKANDPVASGEVAEGNARKA